MNVAVVEDCVINHKLFILNSINGFKKELEMLEEVEKVKTDPYAIEAYCNDMKVIVSKRQSELEEFSNKLARLKM